MKVFLINYSNSPQNLISIAAKVCYSEQGIDCIVQKTTDENSEKFVEKLLEFGHESPIEHASFTFGVEGVSRSLLAQITRHRIASFSVRSQRYVMEDDFSFVVPPKIEKDEKAKKIFLEFMENAKETYSRLVDVLAEKEVKEMVESGVEENIARKKAAKESAQDARFVLPNACETKFVVTMNARSLLNFFRLRCCNRAQWEIRDLACSMLKIVSSIAPAIFKNAGPACVFGRCSEGKMSCKKQEEVREKIRILKCGN